MSARFNCSPDLAVWSLSPTFKGEIGVRKITLDFWKLVHVYRRRREGGLVVRAVGDVCLIFAFLGEMFILP